MNGLLNIRPGRGWIFGSPGSWFISHQKVDGSSIFDIGMPEPILIQWITIDIRRADHEPV